MDSPRGQRRTRVLIAALVLVLGTLGLYARVVDHQFVEWDDHHYVTQNRFVQRGLDARSLRWALRTQRTDNWHPLTWASHMLDVELFGLDPGGHHATNVVLHATSAGLLFVVLASATGTFWTALLAAALFAWHPLRVESVAWVSERKDVLAGLFWIAALGFHVLAARRETGPDARAGPVLWARLGTAACMALGLMAKPVLVTLPVTLLLFDAWPLGRVRQRGWPRLLLEKLPLVALALASCVVTVAVQRAGGAVSSLEGIPLGPRLANAVLSFGLYLRDTLWPSALSFFYPHPFVLDADGFGWGSPQVLLAAALLGILSILAWRSRRRAPFVGVGLATYLVTALPMIGVVQVGLQGRADRYTYLPSIGIAVVLAFLAREVVVRRPGTRPWFASVSVLVLAASAFVTTRQVRTWSDSRTLFAHAVALDPENYVARNLLGGVLLSQGEVLAAREQFDAALAVRSESLTALQGMGFTELSLERWDEAERWFRRALRRRATRSDVRAYLGFALEKQGRAQEAEDLYREAAADRPAPVMALSGLGRIHLERGELRQAEEWFRLALERDPEDEAARRGMAQVRSGESSGS